MRRRLIAIAALLVAAPGAARAQDGKPGPVAIEAVWRRLPGRAAAREMAGNGGRPVAVFVPEGLDRARPVTLLTFFHGHGWDVGPRAAADGVVDRVAALAAADPQTVFVLPQGGPHPFGYWMAPPESFRETEREALALAGTLAGGGAPPPAPPGARGDASSVGALAGRPLTIGRRVVDAHSGGGLAVRNAAATGELDADKVNLIDAAYGAWAQVITAWALERPGTRIESWYTCHSTVPANNAEIERLAPRIVTVHETTERHNDLPRLVLGSR